MRFDLETDIINGNLKTKEIEVLWNERFLNDFGYEVDKPNNGFPQDIHWSAGLFGYFPTYCLGNIYAACLFEKMQKEIPSMMIDLQNANTKKVRKWLFKNIYSYGSTLDAKKIISKAIGKNPDEKPLLKYLEKKFNF